MNSAEHSSGESTIDQVNKKMRELGIQGWSSENEPTPDEHLANLDLIEQILKERMIAATNAKREDI